MDVVNNVLSNLLASPVLLIPILLVLATFVFAILKRLLKLALIVAIAGALYVGLAEYLGAGL